MKIIRWLLSHSFLILTIVVVIYGYMFWGNLLGKDTPAGKTVAYLSDEFVVVEKFVNAVKTKQAGLNGGQTSTQQASVDAGSDEATGTDKQPQVTESAATEPTTTDLVAADVVEMKEPSEAVVAEVTNDRTIWQSEQQPEQPPTLQSEQQPVNNGFAQVQTKPDAAEKVESEVESEVEAEQSAMADGAHSAGDKVAIADAEGVTQGSVEKTSVEKGSVEQSSAEQAFVSSEIEKQLENVDEQGRVIDEPQNGDAVKADWITARKSFYQRNYELSEQSYQKVIDNTENNFDAYGELGNVYFNQGKNQQAASAYFEAAAILVRTGQVDRARSLMGLLHHLDKSKASELQQLIDTVQS